jgi:hypothetical protein
MQDSQDKKPKTNPLAEHLESRIDEVKNHVIEHKKVEPMAPILNASNDKYRRKVICYLKAIGFKHKDIKATINCSYSEIKKVIESQSGQEEIERIQREIFVNEPAKMFETILPEAIKVAVNAMMSKKVNTSIRVDAAFKFMDRALGKPSQTVEHKTSLVRELITKISNEDKADPILDADFVVVQNDGSEPKK